MPILADEYDTALREIRSLRLQLRAATKAAAESRDEAKCLAGELNKAREHLANARASNDEVSALAHRLVRDMSRLMQERDAARADAEALQAELGRVRGERDLKWQPIETVSDLMRDLWHAYQREESLGRELDAIGAFLMTQDGDGVTGGEQ